MAGTLSTISDIDTVASGTTSAVFLSKPTLTPAIATITGTMTMASVDYFALGSNPSLEAIVKQHFAETIAAAVGTSAANVVITLEGSVVEYGITIPSIDSGLAMTALTHAIDSTLASEMVDTLSDMLGDMLTLRPPIMTPGVPPNADPTTDNDYYTLRPIMTPAQTPTLPLTAAPTTPTSTLSQTAAPISP